MNDNVIKAIIEGLLFASGKEGLTIKQITKITNVSIVTIEHILDKLIIEYKQPERGFIMMKVNDQYFLTTKPEHSDYIQKLLGEQTLSKLTQAALETLVIIAYKQPITRVEIEHIRGVNSNGPIQTLLARSLIEEIGRKDTIGRPILFGTSKYFLTYFGLSSLMELPELPHLDVEIDDEESSLFK